MTAGPWPLAVLMHIISAASRRQEPGWAKPPTWIWGPNQEEKLRAAWNGGAIRATDVADPHAGPITHAWPAATLAVATMGRQSPMWSSACSARWTHISPSATHSGCWGLSPGSEWQTAPVDCASR